MKIQKTIMKTPVISAIGTLAAFLAASEAAAQTGGDGDANRFGVSYRMGFNISARFENLGGFAALTFDNNPTNPQRTPNNQPYNYDNGYIYQDATAANH